MKARWPVVIVAGSLGLLISARFYAARIEAARPAPPEFTAKHIKALLAFDAAIAAKSQARLAESRVDLESLPPCTGDSRFRAKERDVKLHLMLAALQKLDVSCDPTFDPKDITQMPALNLMPPIGADGSAYDAGTAPEAIADPGVRSEYLRMLAANAEKGARFNGKYTLQAARDDMVRSLESFEQLRYTNTPRDRRAVEVALDTWVWSPALRSELERRLFPPKK